MHRPNKVKYNGAVYLRVAEGLPKATPDWAAYLVDAELADPGKEQQTQRQITFDWMELVKKATDIKFLLEDRVRAVQKALDIFAQLEKMELLEALHPDNTRKFELAIADLEEEDGIKAREANEIGQLLHDLFVVGASIKDVVKP